MENNLIADVSSEHFLLSFSECIKFFPDKYQSLLNIIFSKKLKNEKIHSVEYVKLVRLFKDVRSMLDFLDFLLF